MDSPFGWQAHAAHKQTLYQQEAQVNRVVVSLWRQRWARRLEAWARQLEPQPYSTPMSDFERSF
jgi:hypothetical protein